MTEKKPKKSSFTQSLIDGASSYVNAPSGLRKVHASQANLEKKTREKPLTKEESIVRIQENLKSINKLLNGNSINKTLKDKGANEVREIARRLVKINQKLNS